jgi:hypothetical protein
MLLPGRSLILISMEPPLVPVSPVPHSRPNRDHDALAGRGGLVGGSRGSTPRPVSGGPESGTESSPGESGNRPAVLTDDGRTPVALLSETRDRALEVGSSLEQLASAGDGLTQVQKLVERMRDAAVVAMDRSLQPPERARLQRQIDLALSEIDIVADDTLIDEALLQDRLAPPGADRAGGARPTPFRAIGTAALGLSDVAVRSSEQALAASGALDVANTRLQRRSESLSRMVARLEEELDGLTNPGTTATGDVALGNGTVALSSSMLLRRQLVVNADGAVRAQAGLDVARVMRLLDSSPR